MNTNNEYQDLFKARKWKLALDAMPLNVPKVVQLDCVNDLLILRSRASEYGKQRGKKVSVNLNYEDLQAIITINKR